MPPPESIRRDRRPPGHDRGRAPSPRKTVRGATRSRSTSRSERAARGSASASSASALSGSRAQTSTTRRAGAPAGRSGASVGPGAGSPARAPGAPGPARSRARRRARCGPGGTPRARPPAAGAVEREHQLAAQTLPERMLGHELLELADELRAAARREVRVDPRLEGGEPKLLQPGDHGLRPRTRRRTRRARGPATARAPPAASSASRRIAYSPRAKNRSKRTRSIVSSSTRSS